MSSNYCESVIENYRHRMPLQMRFNDIDMLGHLNNSVYLTFMDLAKARYFEAVNGGEVDIRKMGVVIVNINANFCAPTFFHEEIEVETGVVSIGEKSLMIEQRVRAVKTGQMHLPHHNVGLRHPHQHLGTYLRRVDREIRTL